MISSLIPLAGCKLETIVAIKGAQRISLAELIGEATILADNLPDVPYFVSLCKDRYAFAVAFCAVLIKGSTNLLPPNKQAATINEISNDYPDSICLYDVDFELPAIDSINITDIITSKSAAKQIPLIEEMHVAAIAFTSGSTGKPTAHKKHWRTFVGTTTRLAQRFVTNMNGTPTIIATVPSQHMYGLEMTVLMLLHGGCIMDSSHPFYPQEVIARLNAIPEPRLFVTTPIHMRSLVGSGLDLPVITKTISATAPLPTELATEAERCFSGTVEEIFGFTEAGSSATRRTVATSRWDLLDDMTLAEHNGTIFISGDHLEEQVPLQDKLNVISESQFEFLGRSADLLNVGGKRASLADLSNKILSIEGVDDAVVFIPDDDQRESEKRPAALVVTHLDKKTICRDIARKFDPVFIPRPIRIVDRLPRSENGKLQKDRLQQLFKSCHDKNNS